MFFTGLRYPSFPWAAMTLRWLQDWVNPDTFPENRYPDGQLKYLSETCGRLHAPHALIVCRKVFARTYSKRPVGSGSSFCVLFHAVSCVSRHGRQELYSDGRSRKFQETMANIFCLHISLFFKASLYLLNKFIWLLDQCTRLRPHGLKPKCATATGWFIKLSLISIMIHFIMMKQQPLIPITNHISHLRKSIVISGGNLFDKPFKFVIF